MNNEDIELGCIGSCNIDLMMEVKDVLRFDLETPNEPHEFKKYIAIEYSNKINVEKVNITTGGSAANISVNTSRFGLKTAYIGKLGDDLFGNVSKGFLEDIGVDTSSLIMSENYPTGVSVILITPYAKDRSILAHKGANDYLKPTDINKEHLKRYKNLQWSSLTSKFGENSIDKCIDIVKNQNGGLIFACPSNSILKNNLEGAKKLVRKSNLLTLNKDELKLLTGKESPKEGIKAAIDMGPKIVACTLGNKGSLLSDGKEIVSANIFEVDVKDTTGAGDAFASGLIWSFLQGKTLKEMIEYSTAISSLECTVRGVHDGIPDDMGEIESFIEKNELEIKKSQL